jgi:hypothetical protein
MNTPTKEQIEAALNYLSDTESKSMLKTLDECATGVFDCVLTERYCAAADILAAAYREQQREIEEGRERWRLSSVCRELKQQRDALAEALDLLLSISCEILKNDEKTLSSIATITDKKSGKQTSVSVIDVIEAADATLATLKGGSDE